MLGLHHPLLKRVRKAARKGTRTEDGLAIAEGFHLLEEAIRSGISIAAVLATPAVSSRIPVVGAPVHEVPEEALAAISTVEAPQGVIALIDLPGDEPEALLKGVALAVALDGLQDPGNAGAIVRAAEAFGATGVFFLEGSTSPWHPKTLRASAGSLFRVPFCVTDWETMRQALGTQVSILAADAHATVPLPEASLTAPSLLLIGNEGRGIPAGHLAEARPIRIPTLAVESLNAALAAGILLYEARRQRS